MYKKLLSSLNKLNFPGGRYTYYPLHTFWKNDLNVSQWWNLFVQSYSKEKGVDLYIHIPFCDSLCTFCGCNIRITKNYTEVETYINALRKEWASYKNLVGSDIKINSIYIGGGSPNFLKPVDLEALLQEFNINEETHSTIELDPRKTTTELITLLAKYKFNNLSIGVQDVNQSVLKEANRDFSFEKLENFIKLILSFDLKQFNFDLIYGLNGQTTESLEISIKKILTLSPTSIATYPLAKTPWANNSPLEITREAMHTLMISLDKEITKKNEYIYLGMGHYVKGNSTLAISRNSKKIRRNISGFTDSEQTNVLIGLGVSAISSLPGGLKQNEKLLDRYLDSIFNDNCSLAKSHWRTDREAELEKQFEQIVCRGEFEMKSIIDFESMKILIEEKIIELRDDKFVVSPFGKYFLKNICQTIERHKN